MSAGNRLDIPDGPLTFDTFGPWWHAEFCRLLGLLLNLVSVGVQWNWLRIVSLFKRRAA